jgi:hypothetical protein
MKREAIKINSKAEKDEREEFLTKGYLSDYLESKEYATKSHLDDLLESKNYVTKDYLDEKFTDFNEEIHRKIGALIEDGDHKFKQLIEAFKMQYEMFERYTEGNEADKEKISHRLNRLESKVLLA